MKVGDTIADRYELEELLGEGGMSSVYRARDRVLERSVAIKVLHEHFSLDPEYVERFRREARAIARLAHPNIVTVIDRGEWEGRQYIVFEHVAGEDLKSMIEREGPLPVERALALAHQVARAIAFAHELDVVHRDVKPHNVLLDDGTTAKVTDFGIARTIGVEDGLTQTGTVLGTGHYISPEQASGQRADERSDQYSVGVLFYELLTGEVPYGGSSLMAVALRHVNDPVPSVRRRRPDVPERVDAIVARAMAKEPGDRFPSMESMVAALEAALAEVAAAPGGDDTGVLAAPSAGAPQRTRALPAQAPAPLAGRRRRSGRSPLAALAVLVFLGAALAGGFLAVESARDGGLPSPGGLFDGGNGGDGGGEARVALEAISDFDPEGDDTEHPEDVPLATDGDPSTFWRTETYQSFPKPGVGIVLDAGEPVELGRLALVSDAPGFTLLVRAGDSPEGPFEDVSEELEAGERTELELDTGGRELRYYLLWITEPNTRAHVNEVRGFARG
ncbi:MAG TPA: protein kinase [Gaiellaceae bacterium]|nr:protein kinase [Gaiellaceae bacterium]